MAVVETDTKTYSRRLAERARAASKGLATASGELRDAWLRSSAAALREATASILEANARDLDNADGFGLTDAEKDRLRLDRKRVDAIAAGLEQIASLPDPIGRVIDHTRRPNGLSISKIRVPLGTVFFIYESRPNVTADAAAICVKSGNAVILRGGKEAANSSAAIVAVLREELVRHDLPTDAVQIVESSDRDIVGHLLRMNDCIDVAIPRGGAGLIRRVADEATMPVIKHFDGNCHVYVDSAADLELAAKIVVNSKCSRMGVCNACESILIHRDVAKTFLPKIGKELIERGIQIRGDEATRAAIRDAIAATEEDWSTEYLGPAISCKVVDSLEQAIDWIERYGSHHTDAIVTRDLTASQKFAAGVDSAAVMINASTRFHDGGEFGMGAEIGISTDKFHARGPCGLEELTSYKYVVVGDGQIRQ
ncbi:MAG TPA: glutamate-5-semialdehyde dehydrogenase [Pirellulaceae bacterium]|jgi:glutamate-5-semialdehyde dehydrogenase|nr:glutamate-5-semialdehyde dehydrogenase [Pirellulaceae bacterium]